MIHHQDWTYHFSYSRWNKVYQIGERLQIHQLWQRRQSARPCSRLLWQPFGRPPWRQHRRSILESVLCWPLPLLALLLTELKDMKCYEMQVCHICILMETFSHSPPDFWGFVSCCSRQWSDPLCWHWYNGGEEDWRQQSLAPLAPSVHQPVSTLKKLLDITIFAYYYQQRLHIYLAVPLMSVGTEK